MSGNFEGIKKQKYGVEVECTGLTRADAAKAISKVLGGSSKHLGGSYDKYIVHDSKNRKWCSLTRKIQKIDTQNTKKSTLCKKAS